MQNFHQWVSTDDMRSSNVNFSAKIGHNNYNFTCTVPFLDNLWLTRPPKFVTIHFYLFFNYYSYSQLQTPARDHADQASEGRESQEACQVFL